jgi:hypothetical protein
MHFQRLLSTLFALAIAAAVIVVLWLRVSLNYNSPYLDECDYMFVGRVLLAGIEWKTHTYIFSSDLPLFVMGVADKLGGYLTARSLAAVLGVWSLWWYYRAVKVMFAHEHSTEQSSGHSARWAVGILALQAPHIFISKFATYDIVCMAFFAPALWSAAKALCEERSTAKLMQYALLASALLFCAVMSKYIALAYAPILVLLLLTRSRSAAVAAFGFGAAALGAYVFAHREDLLLLYNVQILGDHKANSDYAQILGIIAQYCGLFVALLVGAWMLVRSKTTFLSPKIYLCLLACALPLPLYHIYTRDLLSLNKHAVYATLFLTPILADLLRRGFDAPLLPRWRMHLFGTLAITAMTALAWYHVHQMQCAFPNTSRVVSYVRANSTAQTSIMSEDPYLFRYHFFPTLSIPQLAEITWFDNNLDGKHEEQDVVDALWEGKFEYVYINEQNTPYELRRKLTEDVLPRCYELVYEEPYQISQVMNRHNVGAMRLYRRRPQ